MLFTIFKESAALTAITILAVVGLLSTLLVPAESKPTPTEVILETSKPRLDLYDIPMEQVSAVSPKETTRTLKHFGYWEPPVPEDVGRGLVKLKTQSGKVYVVAAPAARPFQKLIGWLEAKGYQVRMLGGYTYRRIAGTRTMSNHARGTALDINQLGRDRVTAAFPAGTTEQAAKFGLKHGALWNNPDTGHFELQDSKRYALIGKAKRAKGHRHVQHQRTAKKRYAQYRHRAVPRRGYRLYRSYAPPAETYRRWSAMD